MISRNATLTRVCGLVLAVSGTAANAQFSVHVEDADSGKLIEAKIHAKGSGQSQFLGRAKDGEPFRSNDKCAGQMISAEPIPSYLYEAQDEDDRWMRCAASLTVKVRKIDFYARVLSLPDGADVPPQFAATPQIFAQTVVLKSNLETANFLEASDTSKAIALFLEQNGQTELAEYYWAVSADSAIRLIAIDRGEFESAEWLTADGSKFVITPEARGLIGDFQVSRGLAPVGFLGPRTFEALKTVEVEDAALEEE